MAFCAASSRKPLWTSKPRIFKGEAIVNATSVLSRHRVQISSRIRHFPDLQRLAAPDGGSYIRPEAGSGELPVSLTIGIGTGWGTAAGLLAFFVVYKVMDKRLNKAGNPAPLPKGAEGGTVWGGGVMLIVGIALILIGLFIGTRGKKAAGDPSQRS